jgi:hypothetical protein
MVLEKLLWIKLNRIIIISKIHNKIDKSSKNPKTIILKYLFNKMWIIIREIIILIINCIKEFKVKQLQIP